MIFVSLSPLVRICTSALCGSVNSDVITFRMRRSGGEMYRLYWSRPSVSVCLSLCVSVPRRILTLLHGPGCILGEWYGCHLVVHNWADLQSVHRFRCYENSAEREVSASACKLTRSMPGSF